MPTNLHCLGSAEVAAFTGPGKGPDLIARALLVVGYLDEVRVSVAARLAGPDQAVCADLSLAEAAGRVFPQPNVVILERTDLGAGGRAPADPVFGLPDAGFARHGAQAGADAGLITRLESGH